MSICGIHHEVFLNNTEVCVFNTVLIMAGEANTSTFIIIESMSLVYTGKLELPVLLSVLMFHASSNMFVIIQD